MTIKYDPDKMRERLKQAVEASPLSQNEISLRSGNSVSYVSGVLTGGRDPQMSKISAVCEVLEVSPMWLLYGFDVPDGADEIFQLVSDHPDQVDSVASLLRAQRSSVGQD